MAILNVTPDSFYDGGRRLDPGKAIADGIEMAEAGADVIDVGGESTRPGARPVSAEEELERVLPVIRGLRREIRVPISIDTYKSRVARGAFAQGADIVNDIGAARLDPEMPGFLAHCGLPVILMHMQGTPETMQRDPAYGDVVREVGEALESAAARAEAAGVAPEAIAVDPGIGFGKTAGHTLELLRRLEALCALGRPVMVGVSRKAFLGTILGDPVEDRLEGTLAAGAAAILKGAALLRTHDVRPMVRVARVLAAIARGAP